MTQIQHAYAYISGGLYVYRMWLDREASIPGERCKNHSTQDSRVVPHRGTNWAALRLTAQIGRDAVLSKSYGRG